MMAPLLWNYFKYYNCSWVRLGLLEERDLGPVGSDQHQSVWYQVTMSTPKYSLNDGQIEGKALT